MSEGSAMVTEASTEMSAMILEEEAFDTTTVKARQRKDTDSTNASSADVPDEEGLEVRLEKVQKSDPITGVTSERIWSEALKSPAIAAFSPSIEPSLHALGLNRCVDRSRQVLSYHRRAATLLVEVTGLYDAFAGQLLKASQTLQTRVPGRTPLFGLQTLQVFVTSWSQETSSLASSFRVLLTREWIPLLNTQRDATQGIHQRIRKSQYRASKARSKALESLSKYQAAVQEAQAAGIQPQEDEGLDGAAGTDTTGNNKRTSKHLLKSLNKEQGRYKDMVADENNYVKQSQELECMGLETLQLMDSDRAAVYCQALLKILVEEKDALDSLLSQSETMGDEKNGEDLEEDVSTVVLEKTKGAISLSKLLKGQSGSLQDGSGVMDAETVGLPEELGQLRDQVRAQIAKRTTQIQAIRALSNFLETIARAAVKLGGGLKQIVGEGHGMSERTETAEALLADMKDCCPEAFIELWRDITAVLQLRSEASLGMASSIRSLRTEKLDTGSLNADKLVKVMAETDDVLWKQLCDNARHQSRAENRYRQSTAHAAKARERVNSGNQDTSKTTGNSDADQTTTVQSQVNKHVTKSLANMFSILPDGGEQALKILNPGARKSITQRNLEDADNKETKGRQALDAAVEATSRAFELYKAKSEALLVQYDTEDKAEQDAIKLVISALKRQVTSQRQTARNQLEASLSKDKDKDFCQEKNWDGWIDAVEAEIAGKVSTCDLDGGLDQSNNTFMLPVQAGNGTASRHSLSDGTTRSESSRSDSFDEETEKDDPEQELTSGGGSPGDSLLESSPSDHDPNASLSDSPRASNKQASGATEFDNNSSQSYQTDSGTDIFLTYFWPDKVDRERVPHVLKSLACSFRENAQRLPHQYGRIFVSSTRVIFVSWSGKKLNLRWLDMVSLGPLHQTNQSILLKYRQEGGGEASVLLDGVIDRESSLMFLHKVYDESTRGSPLNSVLPTTKAQSDVMEVPTDDTLQKMEVVLTKHLRGISIKRFYEIAWSEGNQTSEKPLYRLWLERACHDVDVGEWQFTPNVSSWCKETYSQKRIVTFKVQRKTHLYIGPPIASVKQTHYCRVEGNDKCVLAMTVEFDGIPYSDAFAVEVRWVARRQNESDLQVDVGLFVDFRKNLRFLKSKIQAGTIEETAPAHRTLFEAIRAACVAAGGAGVDEDDEPKATESSGPTVGATPTVSSTHALLDLFNDNFRDRTSVMMCGFIFLVFILWRSCFRGAHGGSLDALSEDADDIGLRLANLERDVHLVQSTLNEILVLLKDKTTDD
jgi:hypothetical protein